MDASAHSPRSNNVSFSTWETLCYYTYLSRKGTASCLEAPATALANRVESRFVAIKNLDLRAELGLWTTLHNIASVATAALYSLEICLRFIALVPLGALYLVGRVIQPSTLTLSQDLKLYDPSQPNNVFINTQKEISQNQPITWNRLNQFFPYLIREKFRETLQNASEVESVLLKDEIEKVRGKIESGISDFQSKIILEILSAQDIFSSENKKAFYVDLLGILSNQIQSGELPSISMNDRLLDRMNTNSWQQLFKIMQSDQEQMVLEIATEVVTEIARQIDQPQVRHLSLEESVATGKYRLANIDWKYRCFLMSLRESTEILTYAIQKGFVNESDGTNIANILNVDNTKTQLSKLLETPIQQALEKSPFAQDYSDTEDLLWSQNEESVNVACQLRDLCTSLCSTDLLLSGDSAPWVKIYNKIQQNIRSYNTYFTTHTDPVLENNNLATEEECKIEKIASDHLSAADTSSIHSNDADLDEQDSVVSSNGSAHHNQPYESKTTEDVTQSTLSASSRNTNLTDNDNSSTDSALTTDNQPASIPPSNIEETKTYKEICLALKRQPADAALLKARDTKKQAIKSSLIALLKAFEKLDSHQALSPLMKQYPETYSLVQLPSLKRKPPTSSNNPKFLFNHFYKDISIILSTLQYFANDRSLNSTFHKQNIQDAIQDEKLKAQLKCTFKKMEELAQPQIVTSKTPSGTRSSSPTNSTTSSQMTKNAQRNNTPLISQVSAHTPLVSKTRSRLTGANTTSKIPTLKKSSTSEKKTDS